VLTAFVGTALLLAACSSDTSSANAQGIDAAITRVERELPKGSFRTATSSGSNFRVDTYRLVIDAHTIADRLAASKVPGLTMGTPTFTGLTTLLLAFRGDTGCDGFYQMTFQWEPNTPRMASIHSGCND
jgi:hypothetical protein